MYDMGNTDFINEKKTSDTYELKAVRLSWISLATCISNKSGVQPFQFEPTYPPGEKPVDSEEEGDEGKAN